MGDPQGTRIVGVLGKYEIRGQGNTKYEVKEFTIGDLRFMRSFPTPSSVTCAEPVEASSIPHPTDYPH